MRVFRSLVAACATLALCYCALADDAHVEYRDSRRYILLDDSARPEGYNLAVPPPNPFAPVRSARFIIPDTAVVALFFTDTTIGDTIWIANSDTLTPGRYAVTVTPFEEYSARFTAHVVIVHLRASRVYDVPRRESFGCVYSAKYAIVLP